MDYHASSTHWLRFTQAFVCLQSGKPLKIPWRTACRLTHPPQCFLFLFICKVRSHLAALKSSGSVASSNSASTTPPLVLRSHSFTEPLAPSFENLHLRNSQEPHHHLPSSSSSSSSSSFPSLPSSTPARTDPQSHPQPRPSANDPAPSEEVPPRVRTGTKSESVKYPNRAIVPIPKRSNCHF